MIDWEVTESGLRVVDADNSITTVTAADLSVSAGGGDVPRPVDVTFEAAATELRLPVAVVFVTSLSGEGTYELANDTGPLKLPADEYVIDVDAEVKTYVRISGTAQLRKTAEFDEVVLTFPERSRFALGFRSRHGRPDGMLTVPPTPSGLAGALSYAHAAQKTTGPDRTYPTLRGHPPLFRVDPGADELDVPDSVARAVDDTGVELLVPPEFESLFVLAPLAYYLGATVSVEDRETPLLQAPAAGVDRRLDAMPDLERDATRVLRKVFFLDCLVRNAGPYGTDLAEASLMDVLGLDPEELYDVPTAGRLSVYLNVPYGAIEQRLPDWHLSTYVEPDPAYVETLPFLLDDLSLVYTPRTSELEGAELVERSLGDFYRGGGPAGDADTDATDAAPGSVPALRRAGRGDGSATDPAGVERPDDPGRARDAAGPGDADAPPSGDGPGPVRSGAGQVATVDIVKPELRSSRVHGWLAEGTPIDVFKSAPMAYRNRLEYLDRDHDRTRVAVVLNDEEMYGEHVDVEAIYESRGSELPIDVTVEEHLATADLAQVFEDGHDFVHYIGHCEEHGLRCPNGYLSATSLDRCDAETFFLNACGSYYEGMELVEKGAVAGAITFSQVLNEHAVKVGSAFARLLVHGFSIERAMQLARRRIMMGKDYAVVGDGTHVLTQSENRLPATATLEEVEGTYLLTYDQFSAGHTGGYFHPYVDGNEYSYLCGNEAEFALDRTEVVEFLRRAEMPVVHDGDFYWSDELVEELSGGDPV